jgi:hypothetical protein
MLRKVHKKQVWHPPSASDYNTMAMAAESYLDGPDHVPERQQPVNPCTAWIKNSSGAARRQFECVELSVAPQLATVTRENTWIAGIAPTNTGIPFAVLLQPVASTAWALGQVSGICPGLVDIQDVDHRWAFLPAGEYVLESCEMSQGTVCIVQHPGATGEQICVILLNNTASSSTVETEIGYATLSETMCTAGTFTISTPVDSNGNAIAIQSAANDYAMCGVSGDGLVLSRATAGGSTVWKIIQVLHKSKTVVLDVEQVGININIDVLDVCVTTCDEPESVTAIEGTDCTPV